MRWIAAVLAFTLVAIAAVAQTPSGQKLQFELASVKQSVFPGGPAYFAGFSEGAGCTQATMTISGTRVTLRWAGLCNIIARAYGVRDYVISGSAKWITTPDPSAYYDIQAVAPDDSTPLTIERATAMLKTLLEDRFQLKFHREMKELPVYALMVVKGGPKFSIDKEGICADATRKGLDVGLFVAPGHIASCRPTTMDELVKRLSRFADRPVLDKTGIDGGQTFEMNWDAGGRGKPSDAPSLFTAIQEQLGLKLEPTKEPVELLVVDSIQRPSEN